MSTFSLLCEDEKTPSSRQVRRSLGQKAPFKPREVWAIRAWLQIQGRLRELALFNLAIDSKRRGCDLVALRVRDICVGGRINERAVIIQRKTHWPVQFEVTEPTRQPVERWIAENDLRDKDYVFPSRVNGCAHLSTRQYSRTVNRWVACIGLDPHKYGTHSLRRTKAALIYKKTGNLRAVQLLLGHTKVENNVRYLGIDVDDALQISEQVEL
jgi:integrase